MVLAGVDNMGSKKSKKALNRALAKVGIVLSEGRVVGRVSSTYEYHLNNNPETECRGWLLNVAVGILQKRKQILKIRSEDGDQ